MKYYIRIVTKQCSLATWLVSGICVDTLHKGGTKDNNNNNKNMQAYRSKIRQWTLV